MKKYIFILLCNIIFSQTFSDLSYVGAKSMGMAGAVVSDIDNKETIFYNPAGLVKSDDFSVIMGTTNLYDLKFIKHQFVSVIFPNKIALSFQKIGTNSKGDFGDSHPSGIKLSKEKLITISQSFNLLNDSNSSLSIGYNVNSFIHYQGGSAGPDGNGVGGLPASESTAIGIDLGVFASLRNKINFGAFVKNINNPTIKKASSQSHFPRRIDLGLTYNPFNDLLTTFQLERILGEDRSSFKFGIEYSLTNSFTIRSGIQMNPNRFGFGVSYELNKIELSYSLITHSVLSKSSIFSLRYDFEE